MASGRLSFGDLPADVITKIVDEGFLSEEDWGPLFLCASAGSALAEGLVQSKVVARFRRAIGNFSRLDGRSDGWNFCLAQYFFQSPAQGAYHWKRGVAIFELAQMLAHIDKTPPFQISHCSQPLVTLAATVVRQLDWGRNFPGHSERSCPCVVPRNCLCCGTVDALTSGPINLHAQQKLRVKEPLCSRLPLAVTERCTQNFLAATIEVG